MEENMWARWRESHTRQGRSHTTWPTSFPAYLYMYCLSANLGNCQSSSSSFVRTSYTETHSLATSDNGGYSALSNLI